MRNGRERQREEEDKWKYCKYYEVKKGRRGQIKNTQKKRTMKDTHIYIYISYAYKSYDSYSP